ncbi:hypothetical protein OPV22_004989 [Ensete ventricosum]|uniref:Uncharacterized protein n=1 Tax=Ensete ventricosum TaxID=4639 RepID=A0AAV8RQ43_ENSVE|nr:hypothetical protein OPV22_004989 [Ensete ventricosum]
MAATSKGRPSEIIRWLSSTSLHSLPLLSPTKKASRPGHLLVRAQTFFFSVLFYFALVGILRSWHHLDPLLPCRRPLSSTEPSHSTVVMSADGGRGRRGGGAWGVLAAAGYSTLRRCRSPEEVPPGGRLRGVQPAAKPDHRCGGNRSRSRQRRLGEDSFSDN